VRSDAVFKRAYNSVLDQMATRAIGDSIDSEHAIARGFKVSRTTVRKILDTLIAQGMVEVDAEGNRTIARLPRGSESFPQQETTAGRETVERGFMELIQAEVIRPGEVIGTADLARRLGVSATVVREYLEGFRQFGLIARQENGAWVFVGFDQNFARELSDFRELIELRAAEAFGDQPLDAPAWKQLDDIELRHIDLKANFQRDSGLFPRLDEEFHLLINSALGNRFVNNFNYIRSFIFHYHYQWNKSDENARNSVAVSEHLDYISALKSRDRTLIRLAVNRHLQSARISLLASMR
jgi:DNA-binding GntR family transcriptional regulator